MFRVKVKPAPQPRASMADYAKTFTRTFCRKCLKPTLAFLFLWLVLRELQQAPVHLVRRHRPVVATTSGGPYQPHWDSLDSRPLPKWFDRAKVGVFVHWGVFSVPSFGNERFWRYWKAPYKPFHKKYEALMDKFYPSDYTYMGNFTNEFKAQYFNPKEWVKLIEASGAKYAIINSKHHDGFSMWPTKYTKWNSFDVGPKRDVVGEFAKALRERSDLKFGVYHSLFEYFNPVYLKDKAANFTTSHFVSKKVIPEMKELVMLYRPEVLWSDGQWEAPDWYWNSTEFLAWLYNESPVRKSVVTNDRWGIGSLSKHGGFYSSNRKVLFPGVLIEHKWENNLGLDRRAWSHRREAKLSDFLSYEELIEQLVSTVSCGGELPYKCQGENMFDIVCIGNLLLIIGPTKEGRITPICKKRLREMGAWLKFHGEAIYNSSPWTYQNETTQTTIWYTRRSDFVYATVLKWPKNNLLTLQRPTLGSQSLIYMIGCDKPLQFKILDGGMPQVMLPGNFSTKAPAPWVLKLTHVMN